MSSVCPCCHYEAAAGKNGHVRSDSLRRHVERMHETPDMDFVDRYGWSLETVAPNIVIKKKKETYNSGFCFGCRTWLIPPVSCTSGPLRYRFVKNHTCRPVQHRAPKRPKGSSTTTTPVALVKMEKVEKVFNTLAGDYIEHTDDCDFDLEKSLKSLVRAANKPAAAPKEGSLLERLKAEKRLGPLKLAEREAHMRSIYEAEEADSDSEADEPGVFDEIEDVLIPVLIEAAKSAPQREQLSNTIKDLRIELDQKEDAIDMLKSSNAATVESLQQQLMELSRQVSEERVRRHRAEKELGCQTKEEAPAPARDTIQLVGGNDYTQWSLPFQG